MDHRSPAPAIEARHLTKFFGPFVATSDVSFEIAQGQVVTLLGVAGAGKSTTLRLLTAFTAPSAGSAHICGFDVHESRLQAMNRIGYLPEAGPLYPEMTPRQMLRFFGEARRMDRGQLTRRLSDVIEYCDIAEAVERPIGKASKGLRQRIGLAQALLHDPDVLIMDEPTTGLDAAELRRFHELIRGLRGRKTLLISTPALSDLETITDRVLLIQQGRLVFDGTPAALQEHRSIEPPSYRMTRDTGSIS